MGVKKSNLLLWVATTLEILSRGRGTKKVKNRCTILYATSLVLSYGYTYYGIVIRILGLRISSLDGGLILANLFELIKILISNAPHNYVMADRVL